VTAATALVLFALTFVVVTHSRSGPGSGTSRSRRTLRRTVKTSSQVPFPTSAEFRRADQPAARPATSGESKTAEIRKAPDDTRPPSRSSASRAARIFGVPRVVSNGTATSDAEILDRKGKSKSRNRAYSVGTGLYFRSLNGGRKSNVSRMFRRQLSRSERATLLATFGAVTSALRASNVTFWMDGGTLLGSYRHHGLIPWDDGVDLVVGRSQMRRALRAVRALAPARRLYVEKDAATRSTVVAWRVFAGNGTVPVAGKRPRWPTVVVRFYALNATHVWLEPPRDVRRQSVVWPRRTVFPLHRRPFDRYWAPAPCDTRSYLVAEYADPHAIDRCVSPTPLRANDVGRRRLSVPCRTLQWLPLVAWQRDGYGSVVESLIRGKIAVRQHTIHQKC